MQTRLRVLGVSALALAMLGIHPGPVRAADTDPVIGTWKLNVAKSKYSPGPPPSALTVTFAAAGDGLKVTSDVTNAQGKVAHTEYTANYDGKDYPIAGTPTSDTVSLKRVDVRTSVRTDKKAGKVVATYTRTVSEDGKTLTVLHTSTTDPKKPVNDLLVLDKQ